MLEFRPDPSRRSEQATVQRPRLTERLDRTRGGVVGLVVAPAGSGKSVLLSQWAGPGPSCWLNLAERHDDAVVLARDLVASVHVVHDSVDPSIARLAVAGGRRLGPGFIGALLAGLAESDQPVVVVLDDLHTVSNPDVVAELGELLVELPDNARLLIGSRWDPPFHLGRLRLGGRLVELRSRDLAFDEREALELLELVTDRQITPAQAEALVERTEGWAAGLQLAALSMQHHPDLTAFIDGFTGDDRLVADYLTGEVLRSQDERVRRFLLQTSVLEWLSPELCDALTGDGDGRAMLRSLAERGLFISASDPSSERFRYHHLFADLLRYQLRAEDPAAEIDCRRRAAGWLLSRGELRSGVEQLFAAGDLDRAFEILSTQGFRFFERGESASLVRWLTAIQDHDDDPPPLLLVNLLAAEVAAEEYAAAGETHRRISKHEELSDGERIAADTLCAQLGMGGLPTSETTRLANRVLDSMRTVDRSSVVDFLGGGGADSCETMAGFAAAMASFFDGDLDASVARLEQVLAAPGTLYPIWRINVLGALALCHAWTGRLTEAHRVGLASLDTARDVGAIDHVSAVLARLALATVSMDRLDLAEAEPHLDAAAVGAARCRRPTYHHMLRILQARHLALSAGVEPALAHLRASTELGVQQPGIAGAHLQLELQLLIRCGSTDEASALLRQRQLVAPAARIDTLLAAGDIGAARRALDDWAPAPAHPRAVLAREIRTATVLHHEGHAGTAGSRIATAAALSETEVLLAPLVEAPGALSLLRTSAPARPLRHLRTLLGVAPTPDGRSSANEHLLEPLTSREVGVLEYLPSRLSNHEIADALYISVNTLKTHLRSIYRKLGVADRDDAVAHASSLGLL